MSNKKLNIVIIGATGYTGLDLVLLLSKHPMVNITNLCATKNLGKRIDFFDKRIKKKLPKLSSIKKINWEKVDLAFLSLPNGEAQMIINKIYYKYRRVKFIDLSADFRINNAKKYELNYGLKHKAKKLMSDSIYSVSEFVKKDINKFRIIANPGCYPTSVQIPLIPLIKNKLIKVDNLIIDTKSGYSGAGKNLKKKFNHKNLFNSIHAYGIQNHKHVVEIEQEFNKYSDQKINFSFNPYILPTFRGILTSIYIDLKKNSSSKKLRNVLIRFYKNNKFIKILKLNSKIGSGNVLNTNNCEISICNTKIKNKIIIFSAIDNLVKGASGQAIQNMNLIYRFPEKMGLI
tara:strand:+ start:422 stop:1456 length:1035 start_codon:yes stop_codon:yes gene_type:complete